MQGYIWWFLLACVDVQRRARLTRCLVWVRKLQSTTELHAQRWARGQRLIVRG